MASPPLPLPGKLPPGVGVHAPPKPKPSPWITVAVPQIDEAQAAATEPTKVWRSLWHSLGTSVPTFINHSRASRKALRSVGSRHG